MAPWVPLVNHSHFSLLRGLSKPEQMAERVVQCGYQACALTDNGSIAGVPAFVKAMNDVCTCGHPKRLHDKGKRCQKGCGCQEFAKANVKAIAGCDFNICSQDASVQNETNAALSHLVVIAKGPVGWKGLIKATSASNKPEFFYKKPRLDLERLAAFANDQFFVLSGHVGTELSNCLFKDMRTIYLSSTPDEARKGLAENGRETALLLIKKYKALFGPDNFYISLELIDQGNLPATVVIAGLLQKLAIETKTPVVAVANSHYPTEQDAADHRVVLCCGLETTRKELQRKIEVGSDPSLSVFVKSNRYHIPLPEEIKKFHLDAELANSVDIAQKCETVKVSGQPMLPVFACPNNESPDEYVRNLCRKGWKGKIQGKVSDEKIPEYVARVKHELQVLLDAKLSSYFLIVADYIEYAKNVLKCRVGKGRGSAAGCLVSYLLGITSIDPLPFGLIFERFYNAGRNTKDRVALPDIDSDFPIRFREQVLEYIRKKYGNDHVCQMATFSRMQGRGALKDVLRTMERCSFEEMNKITEHIPDESQIIDSLQEMLEETGEASIIRWALENNGEALKEWCFIDEQGGLDGPYALDFAQAIRLEGTKRAQGKHASGLIISSEVLADIVPMVYDKSSGQQIVAVDMRDAEEMGLVKFDILGLRTLDCVMDAESIIRTGKI